MTKGIMVITGNSITELKADLKALESAISTGARMGCGGSSIDEVKSALSALATNLGCKDAETIVKECVSTCDCKYYKDCDCDEDDRYEEGYWEGKDDGYIEGYDEGKSEGYNEGYEDAMSEIREKLGM